MGAELHSLLEGRGATASGLTSRYIGTGTGFLPVESNSVEDCANYCEGGNPASGMKMRVPDYNCDSYKSGDTPSKKLKWKILARKLNHLLQEVSRSRSMVVTIMRPPRMKHSTL